MIKIRVDGQEMIISEKQLERLPPSMLKGLEIEQKGEWVRPDRFEGTSDDITFDVDDD